MGNTVFLGVLILLVLAALLPPAADLIGAAGALLGAVLIGVGVPSIVAGDADRGLLASASAA